MAKEIVEIVIPSSPVDRKAVADGIKEISNSLTRIEGERTYIKESFDALSEKYGLDKKYLRRMARDFHKDQFEKVTEEDAQYSDLFEAILIISNDVKSVVHHDEDEPENLTDEAA
jgi:hypothetical protein